MYAACPVVLGKEHEWLVGMVEAMKDLGLARLK